MLSYRFMQMRMQGNRDNRNNLSNTGIATQVPNRFFGKPMQPPTLRVVPTRMETQMHMLGAMYAPNDRLTLMAMAHYLEKTMDHVTYAGATGTTELGRFTTRTTGFGDTTLNALVSISRSGHQQWIANLGISAPTGKTDKSGRVLAPNGMQPKLRLPYPMQLGSGTWDPVIGLTHTDHSGPRGWGGQWRSAIRTAKNDEGYRLGDEHTLTGWMSHTWNPYLSHSIRLSYVHRGNIRGIDPEIVAPVQTANPDFQGSRRVNLGLGANVVLPGSGHRIALEANVPLYQHLDGPQMKMDWGLTLGAQWAF